MTVENEAEILRNAPRYPLEVNRHNRCHICGQVEDELRLFDTHIQGAVRYACIDCHPDRGTW